MKRTLLLSLLLVVMMLFSGNMFAQLTVELGTGTDVNTTTGAPSPYGTWYKAFRQQFLVLASELNNEGAGTGNINSIAFNVQVLNNITPMNNFRIRFKHTNQTSLSTTFETGTYSQVFQATSFTPTVGWNTHNFTTPFVWDGASNLLVDIVTDVVTGDYAQNASTFYTATPFSSSLRFQSDSSSGTTATTGTVISNRSNMKLNMSALDLLDMAAFSITGPTTPSVNSEVSYTVRVRNLSPDPVSNYSVKFLVDDDEIDSIPGTALDSMEYEDFEFDWTPTQTGPFTLYGKVVMPGDENPVNDVTPGLDVTVMEEGLTVVQIGDGTAVNTDTGSPVPYGTWYKNFRQQYLIKSDELYDAGAVPGFINAMAFDVQNLNTCGPMPNFRIRLKHTNQEALSTTFEVGDYTQVFQAPNFMPEVGWNIHAFQLPFFWDGASNLLVEIVTDIAPVVGRNVSAPFHTLPYNASVRYNSDSIPADGNPTGTVSMNRNNMRFFISTEEMDDMAAMSITGTQFPNVNSSADYTIRVMNICPDPVSNYTVKLMEVDGGVLGTAPGVLIDHLEVAEITIPWTPTEVGTMQIYGRVEMPGDENALNDNTYPMTINVMEEGVGAFQVGDGTAVNTTTGAPAPYGTYYKSFRQHFLVKADEIYDNGGAPGNLSGIAFDVSALNNIGPMTNYRIRLKNTDLVELSTAFEAGTYTQVFQANTFMPDTGWNIHNFDAPFFWDGVSNLIVEIVTELCPVAGQNASATYTAPGFYSSLRAQSDTANSEFTATGTRSLNRSNMRFFISQGDVVDMAAISITGPYTPNVNSTVDYTIRVISSNSDTVSNYTVKLMDGDDNVLASVAGTPIDYLETADFVLSWTPAAIGEYQLYGRVEMPGDEYEANNNTAPITVHVMAEGLTVVQIGDGTAVNTETGVPAPYGTYFKNFRQQFLVKADELYDLGGAPGFINALSFDVSNINTCGPMPNYRIRLKDTNLESFTTNFELGDYTQVFHFNNFMPVDGWNLHPFSEPYFWDGTSNLIIEIVADIAPAVGRNASSPYHTTTFNSAVRYQSDSIQADGNATGTVSTNRSNLRLFMDIGDIGSLRGTVTTSGFPMGDVLVSIEDTAWNYTTAANGQYNFPAVITGDYQVTAHKVGFEDLTLPVTISADEETILNFDMEASTSVLVSGRVTGSDNPTVGLDAATVTLVGPLTYEATTNQNGVFNLTVLSGNTYNYTVMRDGYDITTGSIDVGSTNYNMGTIIIEELTLPPGPVVAEVNATETAVDLVWSPPGAGSDMFFDFEDDDGDWEPSADWDAVGDWEYTDNYNVANFNYVYTGNNVTPPPNAYSGTGMWGTIIHSNHTNSGGFSYLSKTFNFGSLTDATLRFMSWENLFGDWDYAQVSINGTLVWGPSWDDSNTQWQERIIDISAYDGMAEVTVRFEMFATTTVNYAGWYIDDVEIAPAANFRAPTVSIPTADIRFAGLSEIEAANLVESETIRSPRDTRAQTATFTTAPGAQRIPVGYRVWRFTTGEEDNEASWTEITTTTVTDTTFSDTAWPTLPHTIYRWAVKTVYTNNVLSDPRFSNPLRLQPDDLSAIEIFGNTTPAQNSSVTHTVVVKNTGTAAQTAGSYTVKIMHGNTELASGTGPAIAVNEEVEVPLTWTPTATGQMTIHGLVILPGDSVPDNDMSPPFVITVMDEGLFVLQLGDGTGVNTTTGPPAPYGTWYKSFRQQFLYKADEIYAMGAAPGLITALAFNVQALNNCSPMPNYRIRLKHTTQETLTTTFETGVYEQVFQANTFMPEPGWNMHAFSQPFIWNGQDNILVDVVVALFQDPYTQNASTYFSPTTFNSSLRYQSDSIAGDTATTGTVLTNRSNTRFFMVIDDMGSLSGTVTENGHPVPNMLITIEDSVFNTTTNQNGAYNFDFAPAGTQTVTASKHGYTDVSHTVVIVEDEETVQNFNVVGTPEFALSEDGWDFGDVTIGGSSSKTIQIINAGGGELTISSITHSGSGSFQLTQPNLPVTLRTDQTIDLPITFTPAVLGEVTATFTITDDRGNRYQITCRTDSATSRASSDTQESRDVHELIVTGNGVHSIHVGNGGQNARMPYDFYWKTSMFQTIFSAADINDFVGMITGIKLYNNFTSNLTNKPIKLWLSNTTQNDLSAGWISSNDMTLVFDGNMNFPSGQNTITINFPEPFLFIEGGNLVLLAHRPMDTGYHSSLDYFDCQTIGSSRSRNHYSDSVTMNPASMSPSDGTVSGQFPRITFEVIPGGVGHIEGIVRGEDGTPLPGVLVNVDVRASATTNQYGEFFIHNLLPNDYTVTLSRYGYLTQTIDITIEEDVTEEMDITMEEMPQVSILGTVVASDTGDGIADATLSFTGYADYTATTNASGEFIVDSNVYAYNTYEYTLTAAGYTAQTGSIEVGPQDYNMGVITMEELAFAPTQVEAVLSDDYSSVNIGWNPPDPDAFEILESFEGVAFPPTDWTQTITNNGVPNIHGVRPTWCRFSVAEGVVPSDGDHQAGLTWIAEHQDEWLFTPGFTCPPDAYVRFDTHLEMGSDGGDHYYVKISIDNGVNWQVLWDGAAQPSGLNSYDTPVVIDLTQYAGQMVKLAWHADDGVDAFGMWYNWYIDNIYIGNFVRTEQLSTLSVPGSSALTKVASQGMNTTRGIDIDETNARLALKAPTAPNRALVGYKVWRLRSGHEGAENNWVLLTDEMLTETGYEDTGWSALAQGDYLWAVRAVYTSDVMSVPVFSNTITKELTNGTISGFVRSSEGNTAIAGATVTAGDQFSATTTANGFYNISLPAGTYTVTATHDEYTTVSHENVVVVRDENTTLNFIMEPTSNEDVVEITVTALNSNYPNPFNPETTISYDIKDAAQVRLDVFNLKGQLVKTLVNDMQSSGRYNVVFTARDDKDNKLSSGLYFYRLRAGDYVKTRKMMLME